MAIYKFCTFIFNTDTRELISGDCQQYLRKKVADVLTYLLENQDRVVSKEELLNNLWQQSEFRENSLLQSIKELRKCFNETPQAPVYIRTVHRKGYEWIYTPVEFYNDLDDFKRSSPCQLSDQNVSGITQTIDESGIDMPSTNVEISDQVAPVNQLTSGKLKPVLFGLSTVVVIALLWLLIFTPYLTLGTSTNDTDTSLLSHASAEQQVTESIAVLPFINATGDRKLQWLELGYSDMFYHGLQKLVPQQVIPIYHVQSAMAQQQLDPKQLSSTEEIATLLTAIQAKTAIVATIHKDGEFLRFNYRIHDTNGVRESGSIRFPNLPSSLPSLVSQVAKKLGHTQFVNEFNTRVYFANKDAEQDYAKGIQALQGKGAKLAKRYFEASLLNDEQSLPTQIKLAETLFLLGEWQDSDALYRSLLEQTELSLDPFLASTALNGMANLMLQQNKLEQAEHYIEQGLSYSESDNMRYQRANLLRTLAKVRLKQGATTDHHQYLARANELSKPFKTIENKADALYYLGSPTNAGLEVDPDINMQENQSKLALALTHYQELGHKRGQALTLLAIGQNYYFDSKYRFESLKAAQKLFNDTGNQIDLLDTLSYTGYFFIQYHQGQVAEIFLDEGLTLAHALGDSSRIKQLMFLRGFAALDQGLAQEGSTAQTKIQAEVQNENRKEDRKEELVKLTGRDPQQLRTAIKYFQQSLAINTGSDIGSMTADTQLLMSWALAELGQLNKANQLQLQAHEFYIKHGYVISSEYALTSMMYVKYKAEDWEALRDLSTSNRTLDTGLPSSYLQLKYLARAYYELGQYAQAERTLQQAKQQFLKRWNTDDAQRLALYRDSALANKAMAALTHETSAHLTYCESMWNTENFDQVAELFYQ